MARNRVETRLHKARSLRTVLCICPVPTIVSPRDGLPPARILSLLGKDFRSKFYAIAMAEAVAYFRFLDVGCDADEWAEVSSCRTVMIVWVPGDPPEPLAARLAGMDDDLRALLLYSWSA